jgi:hypothetical protein
VPDGAIPVFQEVNTKGESLLVFEAVIKALGFSMVESPNGTTGGENTILWLNAKEEPRESISGSATNGGTTHDLILAASGDPSGRNAKMDLETGANAEISMEVGEYIRTLLNINKGSNFLQIAGPVGRWTCNFGEVSFTWPGGVSQVNLNVSHGLGVIPLVDFEQVIGPPNLTFGNAGKTATTLTVPVLYAMGLAGNVGAGTISTFSWLAIG